VIRSRRAALLALAFLVAACSAQVVAPRPTATPESSATAPATARPTNAASDVVYLRASSSGKQAILAIDVRTGQTLRSLNDGAVSSDGRTVYWTEPALGGTKTTVHAADLVTGAELRTFTVDGDLRPAGDPQMFSPLAGDGRLSSDGRRLALMNTPFKIDGDWVTKLAVMDTATGALVSSVELRDQNTYSFVTFAPDAKSLFLEQYGGATRTRAFDMTTGKLVDATDLGLTFAGFRTAGLLSPDKRWLYRLDSGSPTTNCTSTDGPSCVPNATSPYIVALDLAARHATQLTLPAAQGSSNFEKYMLWSLAITPDGSTLYAVNPAIGVIDEVDTQRMSLRRTAPITVARAAPDALAAIAQFFLPVAEAKRYVTTGAVISPDGRALYAAGPDGLAVIDTASLTSRTVWQQRHQFDALRLSSDGRRLYAMDNMAGRLLVIDTGTGASLGDVALQWSTAILRIDSP
jgi:DNA-binding beta-propeller fold protein YncE